MRKIYLDNNATTPLDPRVLESMMPYLKDDFGNPSSIHSFGSRARAALDKSREEVADFINASPREIFFTSGGSESNNFAIKGTVFGKLGKERNHLVTTRVEHESVLEVFKYLEARGFKVTYLEVDGYGLPDTEAFKKAVTDETLLVSCMYANNETGTVMPVTEIAEIVKQRGAIFHTDAVQASGKLEIDVKKIPADLLTVSAHKFYGPKGSGALFIRDGLLRELEIATLIHGGGQERGVRSGTESVPGIVGLGTAAALAKTEMKEDEARVKELRDRLYSEILRRTDNVTLNGLKENTLWNTLNLSIAGVDGGSLSMSLDLEGVAVSTGSACSEGKVDPSHVLLAMGMSKQEASSSVRISLGRFTTKEDIDVVSEILPRAVERIRRVAAADTSVI
ncbi:MAG: cysteine desulfurase family protein [Deltaproteobacteria bacterium]